jgi:hypothetical protein
MADIGSALAIVAFADQCIKFVTPFPVKPKRRNIV